MTAREDAAGEPLGWYDEQLPFAAPDEALSRRFAEIRARRPAADLAAVREVVAVVSSSRGGSTLLAELLRRVPGLLTLPGEVNPHVAIARGAARDPGGVLLAELAREVGTPADRVAGPGREELALACWWRLTAQWPAAGIGFPEVARWVEASLDEVAGDRPQAWADGGAGFTARLLAKVRAAHPAVDPARYDLPATLSADRSADGTAPAPPAEPVVEMAPYRLFRPWRLAEPAELRERPLVVVTPRNAYRLDLIRRLFPSARMRVVHLTRNPAASVNGLIDGWRSPDFFAGTVDAELDIDGYTDRRRPWTRRWWTFDLPPEWRTVAGAGLAEVAALQWRSAHRAVLDHVERTGVERLAVRYEDLIGTPEQRVAVAEALAGFLGAERSDVVRVVTAGSRPVMATGTPRPRRWAAAVERLGAALAEPRVWEVVAALGYGVEAHEWA